MLEIIPWPSDCTKTVNSVTLVTEICAIWQFDAPELGPVWGTAKASFTDVLNQLVGLRRRGLQAHYWP